MNVLKTTLAVIAGTLMLASCANSSEFNQGNLEGTWNLILGEERDAATDTIQNTYNIPAGQAYFTFAANGTVTGEFFGSFSSNYQVGSLNGKDLIVFMQAGDPDYDTVEVTRFTGTEMDFTDKLDEINDSGDSDYSNYYFTKQ